MCILRFHNSFFFQNEQSSFYLTSSEGIIPNDGWIWPKLAFSLRKKIKKPNLDNSVSGQKNASKADFTFLTLSKKSTKRERGHVHQPGSRLQDWFWHEADEEKEERVKNREKQKHTERKKEREREARNNYLYTYYMYM